MALKSVKTPTQLPEDAVVLSESEALKHQKSFVQNWPSESDVIFLKFGSFIAGTLSAVSAFAVTNYFRRFFHSDYKLLIATFIPTFGVPFYYSMSLTEKNITSSILLMKDKCPLCLNLKFAAQQFYCSLLFPSLYAYSLYAIYADMKGTYSMSTFQRDPRKFWKETYMCFKGGARTYQIIGLVQTIMVLFVPYMQHQELYNISKSANSEESSELLEC